MNSDHVIRGQMSWGGIGVNDAEVLNDIRYWVREVGKMQKQNLGKENLLIQTKSTEVDLVTEIDKRSEAYFLQVIGEKYPEHAILSEESGEKQKAGAVYRWVIDPLDGTTNYAQGLPIFAISVALQKNQETVLGVVYLPMLDLLFEAVRGQYAAVNGRRLTVGPKNNLKECLLATGFPYDQADHKDNNTNYFCHFVPLSRGIRRLGSAAYDLANVAAGIFDGYWELNLSLWDVAAGILLVEEAGGKVIRLEEKRGISIIAANDAIAEQIYRHIQALGPET
jgi:myo-inositol-1(or 4)-monophosphatase